MNLLKKSLLSFLAFLILFFSIVPNFSLARAQTTSTWYNQDFKTWLGKVNDPRNPQDIFGERYTAAQVQWVIYGLWAFMLNIVIPQNASACLLTNSTDISACADILKKMLSENPNKVNNLAKITIPQNQNLFSDVFATDRPISGISYVKNKIQNFSIVPIAHAQTIGFGYSTALQPIQSMWGAVRNIAFGLFVLAAVIFAFMIMFRVKISPQVVITVQSAIPKLIIALILVTFSYAIAGFLIDLMYVVIGIISAIGTQLVPGASSATLIFNFLTLGQPFAVNAQAGILPLLGLYLLVLFVGLIILILTGGGLFGLINGTSVFYIALAIIFIIVAIVVAIWITIKTVWALLKAFVNVLLLTIFAPLQIVAGILIPNFGFGQWVKSYLAALSTFVVTGVLILFSFIFCMQGILIGLQTITGGSGLATALAQALGGNFGVQLAGVIQGGGSASWPPLLGSAGTMEGILFLGVSFVLFTMIPKAAELVQSVISGKPFAYGSAIGEAFGPISGPAKFAGGMAQNIAVRTGAGYASRELNKRPATTQGTFGQILQQLQATLNAIQEKGVH